MKLTSNLTVANLLKNDKWTSQFDKTQLELIKNGLEHGCDASIYATPELDYLQMRVILLSLYYGQVDFARSLAKTPNFDPDTMMGGLKYLVNSSSGASVK